MQYAPLTAALAWRCRMATAAKGYEHFLTETDPLQLMLWAGIYKTEDIKKWAVERVNNILAECAKLWPLFADDVQLVQSALDAARPSLEKLDRLGWSGIVPIQSVSGEQG